MTDSSDTLVQAALGSLDAAESSLLAWQAEQGTAPLPPSPDYPWVTPKPATHVMNSLGVCAHIDQPPCNNHLDQVIEAIKALRIKRIRCRTYKDNTKQRTDMTRVANETGASFVSGLGPGTSGPTAEAMIAWVETYDEGVITALEGPNEPNLAENPTWVADSQAWMTQVAKAQSESSKQWVRELPLLAPALGKREGYEALGTVEEASHGNLHVYQGGRTADARLDDCIKEQQACTGDAPVAVTETGYHNAMNNLNTHLPTSEKAAAVYIPNIPLEAALRDEVAVSYIYELTNGEEDPDLLDQEANFGLLYHDVTPKPAFNSLVALSDALADDDTAEYVLDPVQLKVDGPEDLCFLLLARSDRTYQLVMWRRVSVWDIDKAVDLVAAPKPVTVSFAQPVTFGGDALAAEAPAQFDLAEEVAIVPVAL